MLGIDRIKNLSDCSPVSNSNRIEQAEVSTGTVRAFSIHGQCVCDHTVNVHPLSDRLQVSRQKYKKISSNEK